MSAIHTNELQYIHHSKRIRHNRFTITGVPVDMLFYPAPPIVDLTCVSVY